jgi:hypothetical protein
LGRVDSYVFDPNEGDQGTLLLGFKDPSVGWFTIPSFGSVSVSPDGTLTLGSLTGTDVIGAAVTAVNASGTNTPMLIAKGTPPATAADIWHYTIEQQDAQGNWVNACDKPEEIYGSPTDEPFAVALPGTWDANTGMYHKTDPSRFTLACSTAVAAKCVGWKYPPTAVFAGTTMAGSSQQTLGEDMLLACTRMARADYCANATPHTLDGTKIRMYDIYQVHPHVEQPGFYFEAAWRGTASPSDPGFPNAPAYPALCLSKLRWSTLPLGGECAGLPDPRVDRHARFCEEYSEAELEQQGALIYNDSPFYDVGLYSWTESSGKGWFTTSGFVLPSARTGGALELRPGFTPPSSLRLAQTDPTFEGTLFNPALSRLPDKVTMLSTYHCDPWPDEDNTYVVLGYVTTTTTPGDNCTKASDEGYVYSPSQSYPDGTRNRVPLRRWLKWFQVGKDWKGKEIWQLHSMSTTKTAASMNADGWSDPVLEGYLPR